MSKFIGTDVLPIVSTLPSPGIGGQIIYHSTSDRYYSWDTSLAAWLELGSEATKYTTLAAAGNVALEVSNAGTLLQIIPVASSPNAPDFRFGDGSGWGIGFAPRTGANAGKRALRILDTGKLEWADPVTGVSDTNLYRAAADTLKTDDTFTAWRVQSGAPVGTSAFVALNASADGNGSGDALQGGPTHVGSAFTSANNWMYAYFSSDCYWDRASQTWILEKQGGSTGWTVIGMHNDGALRVYSDGNAAAATSQTPAQLIAKERFGVGNDGQAYAGLQALVKTNDTRLAAPEAWHVVGAAGEIGFANNYAAGGSVASYMKDPYGIVHMKGALFATVATAMNAFTLPVGYRPNTDRSFPVNYWNGSRQVGLINVRANGNIEPTGPSDTWTTSINYASIDCVTFRAEA